MVTISIIVPVLFDADAVERLLAQIPQDSTLELVIVDGGCDPRLDRLAADRPRARVIRTEAGRGHQMNVGARAGQGDWLMFLHADSRLPDGWRPAFERETEEVVGGWFEFALDDPAWQARVIERGVAWRVRLLRLPYGDQGLFVRRHHFDAIGGYRELPLMEDVDFVRRLVRSGPVVQLSLPLRTSSRRWRQDGWFRRSARNIALLSLYILGVSPSRLHRWYIGRQV